MDSVLVAKLVAIAASLCLFTLGFYMLKWMAERKKHSDYVLACPKCGSVEISSTFLSPESSMFNINNFMPGRYRCKSCRYDGMFPEVKIEELEGFREEIKSNAVRKSKTKKTKK
ncbi:MAG: hypothetical protein HGA85_05520 [Nanoarchaeota archaeon]|nr:hypothetical protein [Nanoarchaeota archaeon]